jgi:hypothetical protein
MSSFKKHEIFWACVYIIIGLLVLVPTLWAYIKDLISTRVLLGGLLIFFGLKKIIKILCTRGPCDNNQK